MASLNPPLTLPFFFTNGTVADATQVDANFAALLAAINTNVRTVLAGAMTFYVAPTGSDTTGSGLTPTTPAATIQFIIGLLENSYDLNGQTVTIQLSNGSYTQSTLISGLLLGQNAPNNLQITGNIASPNLVMVDGGPPFRVTNGGAVLLQGMTLTSSTGNLVESQFAANVAINALSLGAAVGAQIYAEDGGSIKSQGNLNIISGAQSAFKGDTGGMIFLQLPAPGPVITLTGTPAYIGGFAVAQTTGFIQSSATFVGAATGPRYMLSQGNPVINTFGAGANYFPGNSAGTNDGTGGQYI